MNGYEVIAWCGMGGLGVAALFLIGLLMDENRRLRDLIERHSIDTEPERPNQKPWPDFARRSIIEDRRN